jgi:thiol:disulfide interchange protein
MIQHNYSLRQWTRILSVFFILPLAVLFAQTNEELTSLRWYQWNEGVAAAQASGTYVLVDVYTDWCGWCKKMDRAVYGHPHVQQLLAGSFVLIKLNAEFFLFLIFLQSSVIVFRKDYCSRSTKKHAC